MLSAVETFGGTATAAAHNPFAIAAAAVVMPTQNHLQQSGQVSLEHYTIGHSTLLSSHHHHNHHHHQNNNNNNSHNQQHHRNNFNHHQILSNQSTSGGLYPVYSSSSSSSSPSSTSCSPPINQNKSKSPRLNTSDCNSEIIAMSSTEFVRPHPKQPRYSTANNNNNNNNINNNNNNSNFGNNNINNNNNIGSNGIPLQIRNNKIGNTIGCNNNSAGTKSSIGRQRKYSAEPQSGPVNLVTNNNNNNNNSIKNNNNSNNNNNNGCRLSSPNELVEINGNNVIGCGTGGVGIPLLQQKQNSSPQLTGGGSTLNDNDVISALYSQKLPFATAPTVVSNAIAAAAYQFNYPHIYARSPYGTPALYPSNHSLNSRIQQLQNAFIGSTHPNDLTFSPYLPTSIQQYNNNNTIVTGSLNILPPTLSPTNLITSGVVNSNNNNNSLNNNNNSRIIQQHYTMAQQQTTNPLPHIMEQSQQRSSMLHLNHHSDKELITNKNSLLSTYSTHNISNSSNTKIPMSLSSAGFKIPSGKDGSLKHRFLTRPTTENDQKKQKSQITTTILRSSNINTNAPSNFTKGSFIELCNGVLRKVEDMRTEDFIQSAERSQYHQLADSTVVKICSNTNSVIITFCYDKNKLKADVEVSLEHPFFVYGQGWASCNPELSLQTFGLKCQRLQVGDVCISLISRDETTTTTYNSPQPSYYKDNNNIDPLPPSFYPQNLSRKSHQSPTILTSSTGVAVSSRLSIPPPSPSSSSTLQVAAVYLPLSHVPPYDLHAYESKLSSLQNSVIGGSSGELISIYPKHAHGHEISRKSHTISEIVNSESTKSANATATYQLTNKTNNKDDIQGQDLTTNNISNNNNNSSNDEPIDVSLSRKRKCDDNEDFK